MAQLTSRTELTEPADNDLLHIIDTSDTTDGALGTSKKIQHSNLIKSTAIDLNTTHRTSNGTDHSYIDQDVTSTGTPTHQSATFTRQVVINEGGGDYDTRIEGDTEENLFYVDAGNNRVGIRTSSPDAPLHIFSEIGISDSNIYQYPLRIESKDLAGDFYPGQGAGIQFENTASSGSFISAEIIGRTTASAGNDGEILFRARDSNALEDRMIIKDNGRVGILDMSPSYVLEVNGTSHVTGEFTAGTKTFMIDHPLTPYDKILYHATVEAPRHDLIYRGIAKLKDGKVTVDIDKASNMTSGTFAALTQNAVVTSLQNQDGFDRVKPGTIANGKFEIVCENASSVDNIAWVVMAERADELVKWSDLNDENGCLIPEVNKPEPTKDELKVLEAKQEKTKVTELIGTTKLDGERIDSLKHKKGYLIQPECRGKTRPYRAIEYVADTNLD